MILAKDAGIWKAGQLFRRQGGEWVSVAFYRKQGGAWKTVAALTAALSKATLNVEGQSATPTTETVTAAASGGIAPYSYNWVQVTGGAIVATASASATTAFQPSGSLAGEETRTATFKCVVTDTLGTVVETSAVTVTMLRHSTPTASITPTALNVSGSTASRTTGTATAAVSGGLAPLTATWTKVSGGAITINSPNAFATDFTATGLNSSGETRTATFMVTVTDARGYTTTASITVSISRTAALSASVSPTSLSANLDAATASGSTARATASASGGSGPFSYAWTKVSGGAITIDSPSAYRTRFSAANMANDSTRTATFRCTITDANGQTAATGLVTVTFTRAAEEPGAGGGGGTTTATYTPSAGSYTRTDFSPCTFTISCTESVTWTWTRTSGAGGANVTSGGTATNITFNVTAPKAGVVVSGTFEVTGTSASGAVANYTLTLTADGAF